MIDFHSMFKKLEFYFYEKFGGDELVNRYEDLEKKAAVVDQFPCAKATKKMKIFSFNLKCNIFFVTLLLGMFLVIFLLV